MYVRQLPSQASAAERARWLAELAEALAEAQALTWGLGTVGRQAEALQIYGEIELLAAEVRALRLGGRTDRAEKDDPDWRENLPWASGG
jgi:hypothetical protein